MKQTHINMFTHRNFLIIKLGKILIMLEEKAI